MRHSNQQKLLHSVFAGTLSCLGPLGRKLSGHLTRGDDLVIATCDQPDQYDEDFVLNYAAYNLLRKYDGLNTGIDTRATAITAWKETESACETFNETWSGTCHGPLIHSVIRKISSVLGEFCPHEFLRSVDHSGGASTQRRRTVASIHNKESDNQCITLSARCLLTEVQRAMGYYATPVLRNFSRFDTVPKDSKTDRPIIIENQGNMLLQKGLGTMIRKRLLKVGVDLNDQSINQSRAGKANVATIDLSSASDLIWSRLVLLLLPSDWANVILVTRSPFVELDGEIRELHKIGGMGNGFVFELESLLFWAISQAAVDLQLDLGPSRDTLVTVYGDDIIVDRMHAVAVMDALSAFGFRINKSKSFWHGPFRESCGKHYYNGCDITPIYIKHFDFSIGAWYHLYNSLSLLAERLVIDLNKQLRKIEHYIKSLGEWNYVPPSFGLTAGINATFDVAVPARSRPSRNRRKPWVQGFKVRVLVDDSESYHVCQLGAYLRTLRKMSGAEIINWSPMPVRAGFKRRIYTPSINELSNDYNNDKGDRKFNLRTGSRKGSAVFRNTETSRW